MLILCLFKFMNMNNLQSGLLFSLTGITAVASLSSCASQKKTEEQKPYNIVYIMTDDHTAQMMSCYDKRYMETPNLDRIANDGVRFTNSFVANSLSGPSRACMITGKHSCANKFYDNTTCIFDGSQQTFPKLLQQAGYQTALIGKWHLESLPTGFNYWEIVPGQGDYYNPDFITQDNDTIQKHGYITNIITDDAIDWMENKRDKDKPFCILIHHKAIHRNWLADTCNLSLYEDKTFPLPDNFFDDYEGRPAAAAQEMSIVKDMDMIYYAVFIRKYNPDVVMLQEIDYNTKRNKNQDFTTQLAAELGLFSVFGKAMDTGGGEYGVAILSKYPFVYINNKTFEGIDGAKEPRTLLYVDIQEPGTSDVIRIGTTHLDHSTDLIRSAMAEQINERIGTGDTPTLLGGDFNARTDSNVICEVMKNWQRICDDTFTYPADQPTIKIDYIFGLPQNKWKVKSFKVLSNPEVSDHRALFAEVEFVK